jgi:hypothetical protein
MDLPAFKGVLTHSVKTPTPGVSTHSVNTPTLGGVLTHGVKTSTPGVSTHSVNTPTPEGVSTHSVKPPSSPAEFVFAFANTRDAVEGEKKLLAGGMSPGVMPRPEDLGAGCGICLRVGPAEMERARSILDGNFQEIYAAETAASGKKVLSLWNR